MGKFRLSNTTPLEFFVPQTSPLDEFVVQKSVPLVVMKNAGIAQKFHKDWPPFRRKKDGKIISGRWGIQPSQTPKVSHRTSVGYIYIMSMHPKGCEKRDCVTRRRFRSDCCMFLSFWDAFLLEKKQGGQPNQRPPVSKWWRRRSFSTGVMGLSGGCKCENIGSSKMLSSPGVKTLGPRRHFMWFHKGLGKGLKVKVICQKVFGKHPSTN